MYNHRFEIMIEPTKASRHKAPGRVISHGQSRHEEYLAKSIHVSLSKAGGRSVKRMASSYDGGARSSPVTDGGRRDDSCRRSDGGAPAAATPEGLPGAGTEAPRPCGERRWF